MLSSDELAKGLLNCTQNKEPVVNDKKLNLSIYFDTQNDKHEDIKRFLSLIKHFKLTRADDILIKNKRLGGYRFDINEFTRALQIGTTQTIRKRDEVTQTTVSDPDETHCYLFD